MDSPISLSVLIPAKVDTAEELGWLGEAVESVRIQEYPVKLVVADDGSEMKIDLPDVDVRRLSRNHGVCMTRNYLADQAETEYLMFLDADDVLLPGALPVMAQYAEPDRVVYGDMQMFGTGFAVKDWFFPTWDCQELLDNAIMPVTTIHTKTAWAEVGGFDPRFERMLEDWDYNIRLMLAGFCGFQMHQIVMRYRQHNGARSKKGRRLMRDMKRLMSSQYTEVRKKAMGCCGGRSRKVAVPPGTVEARAAALAAGGEGDLILMEYTGKKAGVFSRTGQATRTRYRFSSHPIHRHQYVHREDVPGFQALGEWRVVPVEIPDAEPVAEGDVAIPVTSVDYRPPAEMDKVVLAPGKGKPAMDDLTEIAGISDKRALILRDLGVMTFETLVVAGSAMLAAAIPGAGQPTIEKWQEEARGKV